MKKLIILLSLFIYTGLHSNAKAQQSNISSTLLYNLQQPNFSKIPLSILILNPEQHPSSFSKKEPSITSYFNTKDDQQKGLNNNLSIPNNFFTKIIEGQNSENNFYHKNNFSINFSAQKHNAQWNHFTSFGVKATINF